MYLKLFVLFKSGFQGWFKLTASPQNETWENIFQERCDISTYLYIPSMEESN